MAHYFTNDENIKSNEKIHEVVINNNEFKFISDNGVFSKRGLDFGTRTLLETLPLEKVSGDILDFGCGYGPIGIYVAKLTNSSVDMLDINKRSIELTRKNAELNKVSVNVFESNIYSNVNKKYDYIISNPPIRVGKKILYEILFKAKEYLKENGELWIVINKDQGAKSTAKDLEEIYKVEVVKKNKGFYIICCRNNWQFVIVSVKL